ncbi:MAG: DUF3604 domain-containing protein [Acidobacteria bacterium]|nr:DUF3604 domain-containing protein [Acidobacteriota bacterium]
MRKATYALLLAGRARWLAGATVLLVVVPVSQGSGGPGAAAQEPAGNPLRNAYFGELHVHTNWSLDAYRNGNFEDPAVAYRFGRGEAVAGPDGGARVRLQVPLDFMAVTDHDVWLGQIQLCNDVDGPAYDTRTCRDLRQIRVSGPRRDSLSPRPEWSTLTSWRFGIPLPDICGGRGIGPQNRCYEQARHMWQEVQRNADAFYEPGRFTTFTAFEWSAMPPGAGHMHRNVIFRGEQIPEWGGSAIEMQHLPERLWEWLEAACTGDCQVLAIPHNTNWSQGVAFAPRNTDGTPFTREGLERRAWAEPLVEIFQVKGSSECYAGLGTADEECNFELYHPPCPSDQEPSWERDEGCAFASDYVRNAWKSGLVVEAEHGVNPFKYGVIAATDDHSTRPGAVDEQAFVTGMGSRPSPHVANPGGLAGVWAESNTRGAIFDALRRRESFGTSGPRIRVRFFGGWRYGADLHTRRDLVETAYGDGVPMGADLPPAPSGAAAPRFVVWAAKDAGSANLQKVQIIKGWSDGEETFEQVYDVACADGLEPDAGTHRCADNGARVDLSDCSYSDGAGAAELSTTWSDPAFNPAQRAFYYARVLENPTCRWSTHRALARGTPVFEPATIKERAWSSPIWYTPAAR